LAEVASLNQAKSVRSHAIYSRTFGNVGGEKDKKRPPMYLAERQPFPKVPVHLRYYF
jgi:hypothetical protein